MDYANKYILICLIHGISDLVKLSKEKRGHNGFNGVGHIMVRKTLLGIGLMILVWILVIILVNGAALQLIYLFYLLLQTADAYWRAKTTGR